MEKENRDSKGGEVRMDMAVISLSGKNGGEVFGDWAESEGGEAVGAERDEDREDNEPGNKNGWGRSPSRR
ncbi:hypothetical protein Syun_017469 [Stephania yunnanensis]|uniref:Uncharacterized protein n=1 Tax=Stephania yunnanensis TaxID=152371 RepID=A0AAP0J9B8_9MAGN